MTRPARYLAATIVIGILVLVMCALLLRPQQEAPASPFDEAPAGSQTP